MGETLLIVDDHGGFRACARELLEADGFAIVGEAADAASAIAAAAELHPDVVLLDVQLPDVDGLRAAELIGGLNDGSVIILTSSRDLPGPIDSPARGFIPKSELSAAAIRELVS